MTGVATWQNFIYHASIMLNAFWYLLAMLQITYAI